MQDEPGLPELTGDTPRWSRGWWALPVWQLPLQPRPCPFLTAMTAATLDRPAVV